MGLWLTMARTVHASGHTVDPDPQDFLPGRFRILYHMKPSLALFRMVTITVGLMQQTASNSEASLVLSGPEYLSTLLYKTQGICAI